MKTKLGIICGFLVLCMVIGCGQGKDAKKETIIGAVLPLTGPVASYGKNAKSGVDMAVEELNSKGDHKIRVIYEDDEGEAQTAVSAAQKLIYTDKVPLIIGEAASGLSLAVAPVCNSNKVILFSPISSAAELTIKGGNYFFRVCPSDAFQARVLAEWILSENLTNVSLLYINNSWATSLKEEFALHFTQAGGKIISVETCKEGDRDFRSQLTKMAKPDTQAFVAFTYGKEGGPFLRQARELAISVPIYGGDVWGSPELLEAAGEAAEGIYFTFPASPSGERYETFAREYVSLYNKEPDIYAAYSYDLAHIIANALGTGAKTGEQFKDYLLRMPPFDGVTGITEFDKNGDVISKSFDRKVIKDGKYLSVK